MDGQEMLTKHARRWMFTEAGAATGWAALLLAAVTAWVKLIRQQNEATQGALLVVGVWWLAAVVVIQWVIPQGTDWDRPLEGLAAAGWQAALAVCVTGLSVWNTFFEDGEYVNRGLGAGTSALSAWLLGTFVAGLLVIWLRGHSFLRAMLYAVIATAVGSVWMSLGLILALP